MKTEKVRLETDGSVARVIINRPERLNALDGGVWTGLEEAARKIKFNPGIKVAIVAGEGRAFSAGLDLKAAASPEGIALDLPLRDGFETLQYVSDVYAMYEMLPVPVIAAIKGACLGAGMELALACDIRISSDDSFFSIPEVVYGLVPDCGGTQRLPRIVGPGYARELVLTGRRIDAAEALRVGLVNHVYPVDSLMDEAVKMATEIAELPEEAVQASKRALNFSLSSSMGTGLIFETVTAERVLGERAKDVFKKKE